MTEEAASAAPAAAPREESVGETLTRAREAMGLSIDDCAQQLKFASRKIEALEQGRYDELPGGTFARGMLRSYARLLKLDANLLVGRVGDRVQVQDTTDTAVSLRRPIPFSEAGKRGNLMYVVLSLVALVIVAWVAWGWQQERSGAAKLTFVPASRPDPTVVATVTPPAVPIRQEAVEERKAEPAAVVPVTVPSATEAKPAPAAERAAGASAKGKRRLVIQFEREAWVEVRSGSGKYLLSQTNPAGTQKVLEGDPPFSLVVGNAPHVRLTYDDKPVDLAPHVKREVARLTLD